MQLTETTLNILMGVLLVAALALNIYVKYRRSKKSPLGRVATILMDLNKNQKFMENFSYHHNIGKMKTDAWKNSKDKIDFLPRDILTGLSQVFDMSDEINERISSARRYKSDSYMAGIDLSKLEAPLARSRQQLQEWLQENMQNPEYQPKRRRGLFGSFGR